MEQAEIEEIIKDNSTPIWTGLPLERSQQAAEQLTEVGIKLGGYRLSPVLDSATIQRAKGINSRSNI
ncbi:MAG: hypothetical protein OXH33_04395 [bacterium]|nr:hypothetical protein [bacterium]